jgi:PEP-CTERM motif
MTPGTRLARYAAIGLCALAQTALTVPNRVPEPDDSAPATIADTSPPRTADLGSLGRSNWVLHDTLARVFDPEAAGGRLLDEGGAPVAEPSTLLLVSFGLFGLILWNRRRR